VVAVDEGPDWPPLELGKLLNALNAGAVEFVAIGGIARVGQGSAMQTKDLDICPAPDRANLGRLASTLNPLEPAIRANGDRLPVELDAAFFERSRVTLFETSAGWIDVLQEPKGSRGYEALRAEADSVRIEGAQVFIASIEDLIAMKLAAGRQRDLADVEELRAIVRQRARIGENAPND